jgi:peptidoglycan DL-endopeptidase LytE
MKDCAGTKCLLIAAATALLFSITSFDNAFASTSYKVKKGDNIYTIAKKFKTTRAKIMEANDLSSDKLSIGRKLTIPSDKNTSAESIKNMKNASNPVETKKAARNGSDENTYTVTKGDSIYTIAKKFRTTPARIKEANDLDSSKLKIGRKLVIPGNNKTKIADTKDKKQTAKALKQDDSDDRSAGKQTYTVQKRDNLARIAKKFNTTAVRIREANNLDSNKLKAGRKLVIPTGSNVKTAKVKDTKEVARNTEQDDSAPKSSGKQTYTVQKRDNLARIAKKFNTTAARIREANDLDSDKLKVGRKIVIPSGKVVKNETVEKKQVIKAPEQKVEKQYYTVHKGDSLAKIAKKFNTSPARIKEANHLDSKKLKVGRKLVIPSSQQIRTAKHKAQEDSAVTVEQEDSSRASSETQTYTVQKKDNLARIAKKFSTTSARIMEANDLDSNKLKIGQKLNIPSGKTASKEAPEKKQVVKKAEQEPSEQNTTDEQHYTVHKGDSIDKIARKFHTTSDDIIDDNHLESDKLSVGRKLVIHPDSKDDPSHAGQNKKVVKPAEEKNLDLATIPDENTRPVYKYHRLQRGETLASVAKKYGISVKNLRAINDIKKKKKVRVGQNLIVGNISGAKARGIQRVDITKKIEQVKELSKSPELDDMSATDRLLLFAKKMLDIPYKFGANGGIGLDCSSFVQRVYSFVDFKLPRSAREQFHVGQEIAKDELKSGDLLFFRTYARFPSHVGIYIGNNLFIHASSVGKKVKIDSLDKPYYLQRYIGAKRLLTETADKVEDAAAAIVNETVNRHSLQAK